MSDGSYRKLPRIIRFLLRRMTSYLPTHSVIEDFEETYNDILTTEGRFRAVQWCSVTTFKSLLAYVKTSIYWSFAMFWNYIQSALRSIRKHKGYSFINIAGFSVGITSFIFIMLFLKFELSYDTFHEKGDRIYRMVMFWDAWSFGGSSSFAATNGAMANVLPVEFEEIESAIRILPVSSSLMNDQNSAVGDGYYADRDFFNIFTFPLKSGDPATALADPMSIVLSEKLAASLFGNEDPVGKPVTGLRDMTFTVKGVYREIPRNSHLQFDFIISARTMYTFRDNIDTTWNILDYYNYVLLREGVDYKEFEKKLVSLVDKYHEPEEHTRYYFLQPLSDIRFNPGILSHLSETIDRKIIYLFSSIATLILIIASVNYINLATARASNRCKDVGIRKTVGAIKSDLIRQYMSESVIITIFAALISLGAAYILHPYFTLFVNQEIPLSIILNPLNIITIFGTAVLVGALSGCYPSLFLASFNPAEVLKTGAKTGARKSRFSMRNILVVFQFIVSIALVLSTLVIYKQLSFIANKDIGFNRDNIITMRLWKSDSLQKIESVKDELLKNSLVLNASVSDRAPIHAWENSTIRVESEETGEMIALSQVSHFYVDSDFIDLYNIRVKEGRNFSPEFPTDRTQAVLINETAVKKLGLQNPVGKKAAASYYRDTRIIGVVEDFHFASFTQQIGPIIFVPYPEGYRNSVLSIKLSGRDIPESLRYIEETLRDHLDRFVFDYSFLNTQINNNYNSENRLGALFTAFSTIALSIAAIGLLGLISFNITRKTREIGIRKVLGSSEAGISGMLVKEFVALVFIAGIISMPVSYMAMNRWLQEFAYRTEISAWTLMLSFASVMFIALGSVSLQVFRAARKNPADSLRHE